MPDEGGVIYIEIIMRYLIFMFMFMVSFSSISLSSNEVWHSSIIESVYPLASGNFVMRFKNQSSACTSVNNPKYHYVDVGVNGMSEGGANKIYSAALAAAMAEKTVTVIFDKSSTRCNIDRLLVKF